jgi:FO synthase subunit 1
MYNLFQSYTMPVTFSRNVFIPLTNVCRNRCGYCGFRRNIGHTEAKLLSPQEVLDILSRGRRAGWERPLEVQGFGKWLEWLGYGSIIDYLADLCRLSISIGLLPHSNPGVLERCELEKLKPLNASMGLMLETVGDIKAHHNCPGKNPSARIRTIEHAGELGIPFTTGILVGIGETRDDRVRSIRVIKDIHQKFGHIQEVIIQNFLPKPGTEMASRQSPGIGEMAKTVSMARAILPNEVAIQVSPNLIDPKELIKCGASDLGGISPETIDYINPECEWPDIEELKATIDLRERLPIYPSYVKRKWYSSEIAPLVRRLSDTEGFRKTY